MAREPAGAIVRRIFQPRSADARKGDYGRVVIAGGSDRYAGVLALNGLAALRAGADLALIVAPRRAADIAATFSPDLITIPSAEAFPEPTLVLAEVARADALVLGGGVTRTSEAHEALRQIIRGCDKPMVLDAEALHAIAREKDILAGKRALLTPNPGEFQALSGGPWPADEASRERAVRALAGSRGSSVIVKGRRDVISDGFEVSVDEAGSHFLTKGGHGDLLAGACGALLARGATPFEAARAGALIVGRAGELAAQQLGESTLASDALSRIPDALQTIFANDV